MSERVWLAGRYVCRHCWLTDGHEDGCPYLWAEDNENPSYGPGNPDWERDLEHGRAQEAEQDL